MFEKIFNLYIRYKTKNLTRIPLIIMTFDYEKFKKHGKKNTCTMYPHPELAKDEFLRKKLNECADYIRDNYDMEIFTKL